jgi:hypothetical protein
MVSVPFDPEFSVLIGPSGGTISQNSLLPQGLRPASVREAAFTGEAVTALTLAQSPKI